MKVALHVCQDGEITTGENQDPEIITSDPNLQNTSNENAIINVDSEEQHNNISGDHLQDFFMTVMLSIRAESARKTAALQKESKKLIALSKTKSVKLTSDVQSLRSEIKNMKG